MINNIQIALILFIISLVIILLISGLGVEITFYVQNDSMNEYNHINILENIEIIYNDLNKDIPYIIYLNPVIDKNRFKKLSEKYNIIQIYCKNGYIKNYMRKKILKAFDIVISKLENKNNINIYGLCSYTDIACYIAHKRSSIIKSLILDIPIYEFKYTLSNIPIFYWTKHFFQDCIKIDKKFKIKCKILILHYNDEKLCELKYSLMKAKQLNNNKIYLYNMKYPLFNNDQFLNHAKTFLHSDYLEILEKWINMSQDFQNF